MADRGYYHEVQMFDGKITFPLKICTSYAADLKITPPTCTGVDGRKLNRINVLAKEGVIKIEKLDDISKFIPWGKWETYVDSGNKLSKMDEFPGLKELIERNKKQNTSSGIEVIGFYPLKSLKGYHYTGRHFHTYPHGKKDTTNKKNHFIFQTLKKYLKDNELFALCRYFKSGEELGAMYEDSGTIMISGLHADVDLKPRNDIPVKEIPENFSNLFFEKFTGITSDQVPEKKLEWRDYVRESFIKKGVYTKTAVSPVKESNIELDDLLETLNQI